MLLLYNPHDGGPDLITLSVTYTSWSFDVLNATKTVLGSVSIATRKLCRERADACGSCGEVCCGARDCLECDEAARKSTSLPLYWFSDEGEYSYHGHCQSIVYTL